MKKIYPAFLIGFLLSCSSAPSSENVSSGKETADGLKKDVGEIELHRFRLNPADKASYRYTINNDSEITMEVNGAETSSSNNAEAATNFTVNKDSAGNFVFNIRYEKIKIHTKKDDVETDADADKAPLSSNPVDKMLGILKQSTIIATVDANGEVKNITGYKELGDQLTSGFAPGDVYSKNAARNQWERLISSNIFMGGVDKLFAILPDSTISPGESWSSSSTEGGEIPVNVKSTFTLKKIENDIAEIQSVGDIVSIATDPGTFESGKISGTIRGTQRGMIELDVKTGMIIRNDISTKIEGTIQSMGVDVPVSIQSVVKVRQLN